MDTLIYDLLHIVAQFHSSIMSLNDAYEYDFTDKELHFIVIGIAGVLMIMVFHTIFYILARTDHLMVVTWLYVFSLLVAITFAIELGQKLTGTGAMELADMLMGLWGFIVFFGIFSIIRAIYHLILRLIRQRKEKKAKATTSVEEDQDMFWEDEEK